MAVPAETITSYTHQQVHREDLEDVIYNISSTETPGQANIPTVRATATYHEHNTDKLKDAAKNVHLSGDDSANDNRLATVRVGNYTAITKITVGVSGTDEAVDKAGMRSRMAYEIVKAGLEIRRDIEHMITNPYASVAGAAGTARESAGMSSWMATNGTIAKGAHGAGGATPGFSAGLVPAPTSGTARDLTEDLFKQQIEAVWIEGGEGQMVLTNAAQKKKISGFQGRATLYREVEGMQQGTIVGAADLYISDFGEHRVVPSRFCANEVLILTPSLWARADLRGMRQERLAKTGDSERRHVICEWTLVSRNEAGNGKVADLN